MALSSGKEVWRIETKNHSMSEVVTPGILLKVNNITIKSLLYNDLAFDISHCVLLP